MSQRRRCREGFAAIHWIEFYYNLLDETKLDHPTQAPAKVIQPLDATGKPLRDASNKARIQAKCATSRADIVAFSLWPA